MLELKVAEYVDSKFSMLREGFLVEGGLQSICFLYETYKDEVYKNLEEGVFYHYDKFKRDKKDPLDRFDGLFNGRTYGNGRFVLIQDNQDDIYENRSHSFVGEKLRGKKYVGNIHEQPELWEKL